MVCAALTASRIARTVHSMLETTPLRNPRQGTLPTPRTVMPSSSTSPTTAETLVVPRSSPTTISGAFSLFVATLLFVLAGVVLDPVDADTSAARRTNFMLNGRSAGSAGGGHWLQRRWRLRSVGGWLRPSAHAHDDALGVQSVVEKHHPRQLAFVLERAQHLGNHQHLSGPWPLSEVQGNTPLTHCQHDRAVASKVHLLCAVLLAHRQTLIVAEHRQAGAEAGERARAILGQGVERHAGEDGQIFDVALAPGLEGLGIGADEKQRAVERGERHGFALDQIDAQRVGQAPREPDAADPRVLHEPLLGRTQV